ncbi:major capsid protein [Pseudomonas phage DDSR119]|nr:major capsid protein [Pseudomonas phage DDSR119]
MSYVMEQKYRLGEEHGSHEFEGQFQAVWNQRKLGYAVQKGLVDMYGNALSSEDLVKNNADQFAPEFWLSMDKRAVAIRDNDKGRELLTDLMKLATPVDIGHTFKAYPISGDIDKEVKISMDGQRLITYDHVDRTSDGNPIPIFQTGFGINWRKWKGHQLANMNTVAESQALKMRDMFEAMCDYVLDGSPDVTEKGFDGQGIRNHRNTRKIDMTVVGIDLTAASTTNDAILNFWNQTFALHLDANYVNGKIDVVWVSPEIERRMNVPFSNSQGFKGGTLRSFIMEFGRVGEFRSTYKLSGNEFLAYNRDQEAISPLVAQAVATVPVERRGPRDNYNFEIWGAMGLEIKADMNGRGSVFYAAPLT